jgi:SAM-dependent methyltransferase
MEPTDRNLRAWEERNRSRREEGPVIPQEVRDRLPPLDGLRVLHVQCGDGAATIELAAAGALVTGVDSSVEALAAARAAAPELAWVHADPQQLPGELLRSRFDLVYLDPGALADVRDLDAWASGVHAALRPLGWLVVHEEHPVAQHLDAALHWRGDYAESRGLGEIVTAVAQAGLTVRRLEEYASRRDAWRGQDPRVPGAFLLRAEKP